MSIYDTMQVSASALTAERLRMDVIASNVANASTVQTADGGPYLRRDVVFQSQQATPATPASLQTGNRFLLSNSGAMSTPSLGQGVAVVKITTDDAAVRMVHEPQHPNANAEGDVLYPDIDVVTEMTNMLAATRAYQANVTVMNAAKSLATSALSIGR